jgi:uncharacterized protein YaaW (UPF0174 family)
MNMNLSKETLKLLGKSILLCSQQFAIGSVLMSSSFSVKSFSKDQKTLQDAATALRQYIVVGVMWMIGNILVLGASYGMRGAVAAFIGNAIVILWIWKLYTAAFEDAMENYKLDPPVIFA